jgi:tetratricopeptide (TPR) repeat protein
MSSRGKTSPQSSASGLLGLFPGCKHARNPTDLAGRIRWEKVKAFHGIGVGGSDANASKFAVLFFLAIILTVQYLSAQVLGTQEPRTILIHDTGPPLPNRPNYDIDAGPGDWQLAINTGGVLNVHYYPALTLYLAGNNTQAKREMDYVLRFPELTRNNPKQKQLFSVAYYVRAMILFHHATGLGRLEMARSDFEESIKCDPRIFFSYLELSSLYVELGLKEKAIDILTRLLSVNPPPTIVQDANKALAKLK